MSDCQYLNLRRFNFNHPEIFILSAAVTTSGQINPGVSQAVCVGIHGQYLLK